MIEFRWMTETNRCLSARCLCWQRRAILSTCMFQQTWYRDLVPHSFVGSTIYSDLTSAEAPYILVDKIDISGGVMEACMVYLVA